MFNNEIVKVPTKSKFQRKEKKKNSWAKTNNNLVLFRSKSKHEKVSKYERLFESFPWTCNWFETARELQNRSCFGRKKLKVFNL